MPTDATNARSPLRVNRDRLMQRLTEFSQPRFSETDRETARQYLEQILRDRGWQVRREPFTIPLDDGQELNGVNLIAEKPGTDPTLPPLLIGAHYDTVNDRSPGADDNASGAIGLLEIAELLSGGSDPSNPEAVPTFPRTLRLVWFDLEEFGLLGSFYHVAQLDRELYGAIVLEMIGYACDAPGCQRVPSGLAITLPDRGDFLGVVGSAETPELLAPFLAVGEASDVDRDRAGHPRVITLAVPTLMAISPNLLRSDHVPFWVQGIGALMVTDTANFRNPNYHRASDTVGTIDRDFFAGSTQVVLDAAISLLD
jgi:Zn-dependent M28 family amino/carboxypeptidase